MRTRAESLNRPSSAPKRPKKFGQQQVRSYVAAVRGLTFVVIGALLLGAPTASVAAEGAKKERRESAGRPTVRLDRLEFPAVYGASRYKKHLVKTLKREVRKADWGVGRGHVIEYRFTVERLNVSQNGKLLTVKCSALGRLPSGRTARSRLSFGGDARAQGKLVRHVLDIVARGVVTRLAEMERVRRGQLPNLRISTPES